MLSLIFIFFMKNKAKQTTLLNLYWCFFLLFCRYVSSFHPAVVSENKQIKDVMRTMGPAKVELPSPDKYLKKRCKELQLPEREFLPSNPASMLRICGPKFCHLSESHGSKGISRACALTQRRPPVPARTDRPPMGQTKGGFIKPAVTAPLKPTPVSVDSHKGHKQLLEASGLVPKYVTKKVIFYTLLTVYPSSS